MSESYQHFCWTSSPPPPFLSYSNPVSNPDPECLFQLRNRLRCCGSVNISFGSGTPVKCCFEVVSYRTILYCTTPIITEPYSWVGFHIFKALCRTCLWTDDVRYRMQAISSSARQPESWLTGPPSTAMKQAFTCKFILTNKQKPVQTSLKGTCLSFSLNSETLIKLRNVDDLYVPAHNFAKFLTDL